MSSALCKCKSSNDKTNTFFFSLMSYRASIPNIGSISISNLRSVWKKHYQIRLLSEEKDLNLVCIITHFRDRHFTMILWPQCSLGTSTVEHLSTASSCHTGDQAKNNIYTAVMATLSQRKWTYAHRFRTKKGMEKKKNNSETIVVHVNNGCTLGKPLTLTRAEQMLGWFYVCINIDFCTPLKNMARKLKSHIPNVDDWNVPDGNLDWYWIACWEQNNAINHYCALFKKYLTQDPTMLWQTSSGGGYRPSRSLWRPCWRASVLRWSMSSRAVRSNTVGRRASGVEFFRSKMLEAQLPRGVSSRLTDRRFASSCGS